MANDVSLSRSSRLLGVVNGPRPDPQRFVVQAAHERILNSPSGHLRVVPRDVHSACQGALRHPYGVARPTQRHRAREPQCIGWSIGGTLPSTLRLSLYYVCNATAFSFLFVAAEKTVGTRRPRPRGRGGSGTQDGGGRLREEGRDGGT